MWVDIVKLRLFKCNAVRFIKNHNSINFTVHVPRSRHLAIAVNLLEAVQNLEEKIQFPEFYATLSCKVCVFLETDFRA